MGNKDTLYKKIDAKELAEMICNYDMGTIFDTGKHEPTTKVKRIIVELCKNNNVDIEKYRGN